MCFQSQDTHTLVMTRFVVHCFQWYSYCQWTMKSSKLTPSASCSNQDGYNSTNNRCMMSLIQGAKGKRPCPVCLVPLDQLHEILRSFPARIVADAVEALCLYSIDCAKGEEQLKQFGLHPISVCTVHFSLCFSYDSQQHRTFSGLLCFQIPMLPSASTAYISSISAFGGSTY